MYLTFGVILFDGVCVCVSVCRLQRAGGNWAVGSRLVSARDTASRSGTLRALTGSANGRRGQLRGEMVKGDSPSQTGAVPVFILTRRDLPRLFCFSISPRPAGALVSSKMRLFVCLFVSLLNV